MRNNNLSATGLSKKEQLLVKRYIMRGELALLEEGMTASEIDEFLSRIETQTQIKAVFEDFLNKDGNNERVVYFTISELERLLPVAVQNVAKALLGGSEEGNPPTEQQYKASVELLDRLGVKISVKEGMGSSNPLSAITNNLNINVDSKVTNNVISIEKVLTCIEMFTGSLRNSESQNENGDIVIPRLPENHQQDDGSQILKKLKEKTDVHKKPKKRTIEVID